MTKKNRTQLRLSPSRLQEVTLPHALPWCAWSRLTATTNVPPRDYACRVLVGNISQMLDSLLRGVASAMDGSDDRLIDVMSLLGLTPPLVEILSCISLATRPGHLTCCALLRPWSARSASPRPAVLAPASNMEIVLFACADAVSYMLRETPSWSVWFWHTSHCKTKELPFSAQTFAR